MGLDIGTIRGLPSLIGGGLGGSWARMAKALGFVQGKGQKLEASFMSIHRASMLTPLVESKKLENLSPNSPRY